MPIALPRTHKNASTCALVNISTALILISFSSHPYLIHVSLFYHRPTRGRKREFVARGRARGVGVVGHCRAGGRSQRHLEAWTTPDTWGLEPRKAAPTLGAGDTDAWGCDEQLPALRRS
jgi:hypothetical protein